jgi:hypothetical protein
MVFFFLSHEQKASRSSGCKENAAATASHLQKAMVSYSSDFIGTPIDKFFFVIFVQQAMLPSRMSRY